MGYSILEHEGFMYKIVDPIIDELYADILGEVTPCKSFTSFYLNAVYLVQENHLYLNGLEVYIEQQDIENINPQFSHCMSAEYEQRLVYVNETVKKSNIAILRYKDLQVKVPYTGNILGNQVYVDEIYSENSQLHIGFLHIEECEFLFEQGKLNIANSNILKSTERYMERYIWKEEISKNSVFTLEEYENITFGKGMYFIEPVDIFSQNIAIFNCVIAYLRWGITNKKLCEILLAFEKPKFKLEYMSLQKSGIYEKKIMDLIPLIIERGDNDLMKKIFKYIDLSQYVEYETEIMRMVQEVEAL